MPIFLFSVIFQVSGVGCQVPVFSFELRGRFFVIYFPHYEFLNTSIPESLNPLFSVLCLLLSDT